MNVFIHSLTQWLFIGYLIIPDTILVSGVIYTDMDPALETVSCSLGEHDAAPSLFLLVLELGIFILT